MLFFLIQNGCRRESADHITGTLQALFKITRVAHHSLCIIVLSRPSYPQSFVLKLCCHSLFMTFPATQELKKVWTNKTNMTQWFLVCTFINLPGLKSYIKPGFIVRYLRYFLSPSNISLAVEYSVLRSYKFPHGCYIIHTPTHRASLY